jgi:hypothetical protein
MKSWVGRLMSCCGGDDTRHQNITTVPCPIYGGCGTRDSAQCCGRWCPGRRRTDIPNCQRRRKTKIP